MALGFTSHYTKSEQPFGTLVMGNNESETAGSVASDSNNNSFGLCSIYTGGDYDCCDFSVSVNIDYSQYANFVSTSSSGSTETAGSVAFSTGGASVSSFSGGGASCSCSTSFTC